ncbi:MAG: hypothetical protein GWN79_03430, partial [Actinobacteria bacterium]|nr:hypothetical protein [Actinomycetota bacterium]NIS29524.1 hypothetical protein [Actinomycetota bacterium]NIT94582.1 hypothetical protein [Actinomycetota bacterium]NIU18192.1 hypothetical protein [Actinomycetota bacterium]NIU64867.1 hypothetical protein [Actinomycetota bacterium]
MHRLSLLQLSLAVGVVLGLGAGVAAYVLRDEPPLPPCDLPTEAQLVDTVEASARWMARALQPNDRYWYEYDRVADEFAANYFDVRHAGVMLSLYQVAAEGDLSVLPAADGGLQYVLDNLTTVGDITAFDDYRPNTDLGSSALVVAGLAHRRAATADDRYDDLMRAMGRYMQSLLRDDGGMWFGAFAPDLEPMVGRTSTFYTGEAFWAFGLLANQFPGEGWDESALAVAHYLATERDDEEEIENPPHPDQWSAYGFAEMREWRELEGEELGYIRALIGQYHGRMEREIRREANRVGDGTEAPDETVTFSRGAAFGTTVEALSALWKLSTVDPGIADLEPQLRTDLLC